MWISKWVFAYMVAILLLGIPICWRWLALQNLVCASAPSFVDTQTVKAWKFPIPDLGILGTHNSIYGHNSLYINLGLLQNHELRTLADNREIDFWSPTQSKMNVILLSYFVLLISQTHLVCCHWNCLCEAIPVIANKTCFDARLMKWSDI